MDTTEIEPRKATAKPGKSAKSPSAKTRKKVTTQSNKASGSGKIALQKGRTASVKASSQLTPQQRYEMIATTAYFMAERNGFRGDSTQNWLEAEQLVDQQLNSQRSSKAAS